MKNTLCGSIIKTVACLLLASLSLIGTTFANAQATDLHDAASQLTKKLNDDPDVQKITGEHIVIAPFENINGKGDAVPRILQEMLTTDFIKTKHFKVLERDQLQSALDELHFQLSDLADPAKAKKIGKLAGAAYVLLGSIADTGSTTSINARIVSIENGESVAAEDIDIKTGDAPLVAEGVNPSLISSPIPPSPDISATPKATASAVDLNTNAIPTTAGQFTGKKSDFGLLGGTTFKVAWREDLGDDPVYSFSSGDILGDGTSRLVLYNTQDGNQTVISVFKWSEGDFKRTWFSGGLQNDHRGGHLRVLPMKGKSAYISLSGYTGFSPGVWRWNGTNYADVNVPTPNVFDYVPAKGYCIGLTKNDNNTSVFTTNIAVKSGGNIAILTPGTQTYAPAYAYETATADDFDNDGNLEFAIVGDVQVTDPFPGKPIEIYSFDGKRKAILSAGYGLALTTWNPTRSRRPFIVADRNLYDKDGKSSGGYVCFIQWNGETYEQVWKSNKMGDAVIDMQVCDPKNEGRLGLVILSKENNNYYLTKIVSAN